MVPKCLGQQEFHHFLNPSSGENTAKFLPMVLEKKSRQIFSTDLRNPAKFLLRQIFPAKFFQHQISPPGAYLAPNLLI